jgi:hypothetical protein
MNPRKEERERRGCRSLATSFSRGGGGGDGVAVLGVSGALAQERGCVEANGRKRERGARILYSQSEGPIRRPERGGVNGSR